MTAVIVMATALLGGLFWANYRRPRRYYGGPIEQNINVDDAGVYCDDACDHDEAYCAADDYQDDDRGSSSDYGSSSAPDRPDD